MDEDRSLPLFMLWVTGLLCLLLSTFNVLTSLLHLLTLILFAFGFGPQDPQFVQEMSRILEQYPITGPGFSVFNGVLWLMVTIMTINLLRLREWSRIGVLTLIGVDLVLTLLVAVYNAYQYHQLGAENYTPLASVGETTTILEVLICIVLCHPAISSITQSGDHEPPHLPHQDKPWDRT